MLESRQLQGATEKLPKLGKASTREYWATRLKHVVGARLLKPQRMLSLTLAEERARALETWKDWDFKLHPICFGDLSWLESQVMDSAGFRGQIKLCVFSFSDQIPFWVKVKGAKQLYGHWETLSKKGKTNSSAAMLKQAGSWSQEMTSDAADFFEGGQEDVEHQNRAQQKEKK